MCILSSFYLTGTFILKSRPCLILTFYVTLKIADKNDKKQNNKNVVAIVVSTAITFIRNLKRVKSIVKKEKERESVL